MKLVPDLFEVRPNERLVGLDKKKKFQLIDEAAVRGLTIKFNMTRAGARINNKIYSVHGLRHMKDSLLTPYEKPIQVFHNDDKAAIGRAKAVEYVPMLDEASRFVKKLNVLQDMYAASEKKDLEKFRDLFNASKVLLNKKWTGLGKAVVTARITDAEAIKNFLNGTYLTFSGGQDTDTALCSVCLKDWKQNDYCEHTPGEMYDGVPCVILFGDYEANEISVVNNPADKFAFLLSMQEDSEKKFYTEESDINVESSMSDSMGDAMEVSFMNILGDVSLLDREAVKAFIPSLPQEQLKVLKTFVSDEELSGIVTPLIRNEENEVLKEIASLKDAVKSIEEKISVPVDTSKDAELESLRTDKLKFEEDYKNALKEIENLTEKISVLENNTKQDKVKEPLKPVENPSVVATSPYDESTMSSFDKSVVNKLREIASTDKDAARVYAFRNQKLVSKGINLLDIVKE